MSHYFTNGMLESQVTGHIADKELEYGEAGNSDRFQT